MASARVNTLSHRHTPNTHTPSHADTVTHCSELPRNTFGCLDSWRAQTLRSLRQLPEGSHSHKCTCRAHTLPHAQSMQVPECTLPPCIRPSANSNHKACIQDLHPLQHMHPPLRTQNAQRSLSPRALTGSLSATLAGRFLGGCLTASVVMGPRSPGHGGGGAVPFPKGARGAKAPGGAWDRGPAPPARSPCTAAAATPRAPAPARAPGAGGGS